MLSTDTLYVLPHMASLAETEADRALIRCFHYFFK